MTPPLPKNVLVIEDEPDMVRGLRDAMEFEGLTVASAETGKKGITMAREEPPDLIILDLMLPDINGYQVCEEVRAFNPHIPIIMLTARSQELDKIRGLEAGADDYVTKPFSVGEFLARIKALFRRMERVTTPADEQISIGASSVDLKKHTLTINRKTMPLSFYEVELLKLLYERKEEPVSRDEILDRIWGIEANPTNRTVDNFIVKLRRKIEADHKKPRHILTVYGLGYKLLP
jgi:two-component system, OmpR family, alkaline phosphatase synthesis response regulator PhoP